MQNAEAGSPAIARLLCADRNLISFKEKYEFDYAVKHYRNRSQIRLVKMHGAQGPSRLAETAKPSRDELPEAALCLALIGGRTSDNIVYSLGCFGDVNA